MFSIMLTSCTDLEGWGEVGKSGGFGFLTRLGTKANLFSVTYLILRGEGGVKSPPPPV